MKTRFMFRDILTLSMCILFSSVILTSCREEDEDLKGNWARISDFTGVNRYGAASFVIGDRAYIVGGYNCSDAVLVSDCWRYDIYDNRWVEMSPFPGTARVYAFGFTSNGKGYVGCGYNNKTYTKFKDVWEFDPSAGESGTWTQVEDFADNTIAGCERYGCTTFTVNNVGYVCGGTNTNILNEVWAYDATKAIGSRWSRKSDLPKKRMDAQAFVIDDVAYVVGGINNGTNLTDFYAYDYVSDKWQKKRDIYDATSDDFDNDYIGITRSAGSTFVIGGRGYLTVGKSSNLSTSTWEYKPSEDQWYQRYKFEGSAREYAVGFSLNDRGFIATGKSSNLSFDDVWEFQPLVDHIDEDNN